MPAVLTPHSRNIALVVAAAMFAQLLDGVIIVTALPQMARDFQAGTLEMSMGVALAIMYSINMLFQSFGAVSTITTDQKRVFQRFAGLLSPKIGDTR